MDAASSCDRGASYEEVFGGWLVLPSLWRHKNVIGDGKEMERK